MTETDSQPPPVERQDAAPASGPAALGPAAALRNAPSSPPEAWNRAHQAALRALSPIERFLHVEASSGIVLLVAAAFALAWANSPWSASYHALWHTPIGIGVGSWHFERDLHFWINDGLMVIFFFVVGLEIRREMHEGELADLRRAALPVAAAIGGMLAPAALFLALNHDRPTASGWGVPMATDIAFAVGILALLGKRVPPALRVLLLALAIIDDIGAILVIAIFYSSGVQAEGLALALAGLVVMLLMQRFGVRNTWSYVPGGVVVWLGMLSSGVHPTIAGVIVGLLAPARPWFGRAGFVEAARTAIADFDSLAREQAPAQALCAPLARLTQASQEAVAPVVRLNERLHGWVAFAIMPLFALANAGVSLSGERGSGSLPLMLGVFVGLTVGKPLGVVGLSLLASKIGICKLPAGVSWRGLTVVGMVAGVGFTMALFIAALAFADPAQLAPAKLAVLAASAAAAVATLLLGRLLLPPAPSSGAATSALTAEREADR